MALAMIEGAERDGSRARRHRRRVHGRQHRARARLVCRAKGYGALIVMADCFTEERFALLAKVDHVEPIGDDEAVEMTRRLAQEEGVFAGISTGANVVGAHRLAERLGPDAVIVTLAVDTGFKYLSVSPYAELR